MATDLFFKRLLDNSKPVDLLFGLTEGGGPDAAEVTFNVTLPLSVSIQAAYFLPESVTFSVVLPLQANVQAVYDNAVMTGPQANVGSSWDVAERTDVNREMAHQQAVNLRMQVSETYEEATPTRANRSTWWQQSDQRRTQAAAAWQEGTRLTGRNARSTWEETARLRRQVAAAWQEGTRVTSRPSTSTWQETGRLRTSLTGKWQEATPAQKMLLSRFASGNVVSVSRRMPWQEAMKPLPGKSVPPIVVPPEIEPCYEPPIGSAVHLLFQERWDGTTDLIFSCGDEDEQPPAQIVVPVQRVYIVINQTSLWRVDGNVQIPAYSMSLSLDVDSWTWSFSASVPGTALADLEPAAFGEPVELEARINGSTYRLLAESLSRERTFGSNRISVRGRGKSAMLDSPYAPMLSFGNSTDRTAQQLMADVLTQNGVSIGWDVDWNLTDWLVPAGAWATQGSYIAALNQIAGAAGGYIQPHRTDQEIKVLSRYPVAPWDWATEVSPDFELPSAYTTREALEWVEKARYNRVFVSGQAGGILGDVKRAGTAGDVAAQMITDPLITHADAARQRGRVVLSDTGRIAMLSLRTPTDITGIIEPGKFVRYVDGAVTRLGIVRSTTVDVTSPDVWQTLGVETHVD